MVAVDAPGQFPNAVFSGPSFHPHRNKKSVSHPPSELKMGVFTGVHLCFSPMPTGDWKTTKTTGKKT